VTFWLVAREQLRRAFTSRLLILFAVAGVLFLVIASCLFGARFYNAGHVYDVSEQLGMARAVSYHIAAAWGILLATMLAMGAASRPLEDGRAAMLLAKPVRRRDVLLGQLLGAFLTAAAAAGALAVIATAFCLARGGGFPATLWLAFAAYLPAVALAVALVAFFSLFLPRVVATMLGIIVYVGSLPAAFPSLRDIVAGGAGAQYGLNFLWYMRWGAEVYFAAAPPLAGVQLRGADLLAMKGWTFDGWLTLATAAVYIALLFIASWALYARRDV
jgi:ABC-type transport system involved in multi-copper enzyme maturation permease subunit